MAYLQERVVAYVTMDPNLFVAEERLLRFGPDKDKDVWWIDALIVDPWGKMFYLGEATYDLRPNRLIKKLATFAAKKTDVLAHVGRSGAPKGWDIRPWLFLRQDAVKFVTSHLPPRLFPRITKLEETAFPWEYEKIRAEGKEPKRPYPDLDSRYQT